MGTSQKRTGMQGRRACLKAAAQAMLIYGANLEVFNLTDVARLGYPKMTAWRAIETLLDWGAVRRVAAHAYMISPEMKARFLREVAMSQARAKAVLFEAFGMERWDEQRVDSFLSDFKEDWRRRSSAEAAKQQPPPPAGTTC